MNTQSPPEETPEESTSGKGGSDSILNEAPDASTPGQAGDSPLRYLPEDSELELPLAERNRRRRERFLIGLVAAVIAALVLMQPLRGLTKGVGDSALFLFLNALTVILIVLLVFLIIRNFVKLVFERRRGILGSHLHLKFVFAFILITAVPTTGLFVVSAGFIQHSIDKWFSVQVDSALEQSREVAESYYDELAQRALFFGETIARQITAEQLLREENRERLSAFIEAKQLEYNLGVVEVFSSTGEELVTSINPSVPAANFSRPDSEFVSSALAGKPDSIVGEMASGDVVRGAVPIESSFLPGEPVGVVVVNTYIPFAVARKTAEIRRTWEEYRALQPQAGHIRAAYQLELLLAFFVILLLATWMGFRMAKGVTGPIRALAEGTAEVAKGNLDIVVQSTSDDEIGFLVDSFNGMIRDQRTSRAELVQSNAELEQRRRYMEIVLQNIGAGVVSLDSRGRISTINPAARRLLSIDDDRRLIGSKIEEFVSREEYRDIAKRVVKRMGGVEAWESVREQIQIPVGDEVLTLRVTITPLKDEEGRGLGAVVVLDDYSQIVKVQRMEAWREVARRIAHEIKNPLTPIQLSAQRIRRRFRDRLVSSEDDARVFDECVDSITGHVESLKLLVNEFANFARLPTINPKPDDLNRIVSEVVGSYEGTESVRFLLELDEQLPLVDVDSEQMRRVLTNLIDNAIFAIEEGEQDHPRGVIELGTTHDTRLQIVRLDVADNGVGMTPEQRSQIFEPYFSTKKHGTGLGLSIVSRIVSDHNGYIRVHGNRPRGTRFVIELPVRVG